MAIDDNSFEALKKDIEGLKQVLGKEVLKKIGREKEEKRIEPFATIFDYELKQLRSIKILILGLNGHFNEKTPNEDQPAQNGYPYFNYFRKDFFRIQPEGVTLFDESEIGFFDLIPVRTGRKNLLHFDKFKNDRELRNKIRIYLENGIKLFDPEIILTNSTDVAKFISKWLLCDYSKFGTTVYYYPLKGKKIPVILSGNISGARKIDEFNRVRILREIIENNKSASERLKNRVML
ncbi:MAG: hypothetical protein QW364_01280 [Thermoplasmatales archaeon]